MVRTKNRGNINLSIILHFQKVRHPKNFLLYESNYPIHRPSKSLIILATKTPTLGNRHIVLPSFWKKIECKSKTGLETNITLYNVSPPPIITFTKLPPLYRLLLTESTFCTLVPRGYSTYNHQPTLSLNH